MKGFRKYSQNYPGGGGGLTFCVVFKSSVLKWMNHHISPCIFLGHDYVKLVFYLFFASVEFIFDVLN